MFVNDFQSPLGSPRLLRDPFRIFHKLPRAPWTSQIIPADPQGPIRYAQAHQRIPKDAAKTTNDTKKEKPRTPGTKPAASKPSLPCGNREAHKSIFTNRCREKENERERERERPRYRGSEREREGEKEDCKIFKISRFLEILRS